MKNNFETLRLERKGEGLMWLTLNRPTAANAFNTQMADELSALWPEIEKDQDLRVLVLTGAGKVFCAGADLKERHGMSDGTWAQQHKIFEAMAYGLADLSLPTIAAVNGAAFGGGCELFMACDFAYAVAGAKLALPEVTLGIMPGIGGTQTLTRALGQPRAKEILMTGKAFTAEEACAWGLINRVCAQEALIPAVQETAERIAANAPLAVRAAKAAARAGLHLDLPGARDVELEHYNKLFASTDRLEGIAAFNEKRKARFKGE